MVQSDDDENQPLMTDSERREGGVPADDAPAGHSSTSDSSSGPRKNNDTTTTTVTDAGHPDAPLPSSSDNNSSSSPRRGTLDIEESGSGTSTPRFMHEQNPKSSRWIPYPLRRIGKAIAKWTKGPSNSTPYHITPLFPPIQEAPLVLVNRLLPKKKHRYWLVFLYFSVWLIAFVLVKRQGELSSEIAGWGKPQTIGCGQTWFGKGNSCGVDGNDCRPFNDTGFAFRCPANCESYHVLNPRAVGTQEIIYRPFIIGGPTADEEPTYRGDSFICGAAIHAGIISNSGGGCGVVELVGEQDSFASSTRNGIESVGFDSWFPQSFRFQQDVKCAARDSRWSLLAISAVFTGVLALFTAIPALFFFPSFVGIFWTVGMATDPPSDDPAAELFSLVLGRFLPAMFCAWVMYDKMGVRRTLFHLTAQFEKAILWLGPCWVGALDNYTLSFIPIQRLNAHDLQQQPGAKGALAAIIIVLFVVIVSQIWFFRQEGRLRKILQLYGLLILAILISLTLPGLNLRIHHYFLALLLLPATGMQTRPSLVYQGLLIGLFINGIARWGFDPILQTSAALQGDATKGTRLPELTDILPRGASNITFSWEAADVRSLDGISILVNDVERYRSYFADGDFTWTWARDSDHEGLPEYFRFGYMMGRQVGDYTKAGTWTGDGEWVAMEAGPSKL